MSQLHKQGDILAFKNKFLKQFSCLIPRILAGISGGKKEHKLERRNKTDLKINVGLILGSEGNVLLLS